MRTHRRIHSTHTYPAGRSFTSSVATFSQFISIFAASTTVRIRMRIGSQHWAVHRIATRWIPSNRWYWHSLFTWYTRDCHIHWHAVCTKMAQIKHICHRKSFCREQRDKRISKDIDFLQHAPAGARDSNGSAMLYVCVCVSVCVSRVWMHSAAQSVFARHKFAVCVPHSFNNIYAVLYFLEFIYFSKVPLLIWRILSWHSYGCFTVKADASSGRMCDEMWKKNTQIKWNKNGKMCDANDKRILCISRHCSVYRCCWWMIPSRSPSPSTHRMGTLSVCVPFIWFILYSRLQLMLVHFDDVFCARA